MGLLQNLFGQQQNQQPMPQSLIQGILSSRLQQQPGAMPQQITPDLLNAISQGLQPSYEDIGNAAVARYAQRNPSITAQSMTDARLQPQIGILNTLGNVNQSQIQLAQLNEMMRHNRAAENNNPNMQPITTAPTTQGGGAISSPGNSAIQSNNLPPVGNVMPNGQPDNAATVFGDNQGNDIPGVMAKNRQATQNPQASSNLTPLFKGNEPYTDGLEKGFQWAQTPDGKKVAMQIPGTTQKGANGELLTTDANGNVTQQIPVNPAMRQKFEQNIQLIAQKFNELHNLNGTVEAGGKFLENKRAQLAGSKGAFGIPGGQQILEGSPEQALRGEIQNLIKQTTPLYMQAMGITPGMERAVSAQQMLQDALGGAVTQSRQQNMSSLVNLSKQAGTGQLAQQLEQMQQQPQAQGIGQRINVITPDGKPGTIDAAHVDDLLQAGGKLAQ